MGVVISPAMHMVTSGWDVQLLLLLAVAMSAAEPHPHRYSCVVCHALVERVVHRVVESIKEKPFEPRTARTSQQQFNPTSVIDALLSEDHEATDSFAADCKENLRAQRGLFMKALRGVPVSPNQIYRLKQQICGACGEHAPREPPFGNDQCGHCLSIARDLSLEWAMLPVHSRNTSSAWSTVENVCDGIHTRHPPAHAVELRESCDELAEDVLGEIQQLLAELPGAKGLMPTDATIQFSRDLCLKGASLCRPKRFRQAMSMLVRDHSEL